jgi:hypothetical protein
MTSLRRLIAEHPEWADLPLVVYREDGDYDFVGTLDGAASVYPTDLTTARSDDDPTPTLLRVLVFAAN